MKLLVTGSRDFFYTGEIHSILNKYINEGYDLIVGDCPTGVDKIAFDLWETNKHRTNKQLNIEVYKADWKLQGKRAGIIRNQKMVNEGNPDLCIAFILNNSRGATHCSEYATHKGVHTINYFYTRDKVTDTLVRLLPEEKQLKYLNKRQKGKFKNTWVIAQKQKDENKGE